MMGFLGMFFGGWIGWALGALFSTAAAFCLSIVGTGLGLYLARRIMLDHF